MLDNDNSTETPETPAVAEPPATSVPAKRVRVSALAKDLGTTSKALIALLTELGAGTKTASSALDADLADRVRTAHAQREQNPTTQDAVAAVAGVETVATEQTQPGAGAPSVLFQAPLPTAEAAGGGPDIAAAEDAEDLTAEPEDVREVASEEAGAARRRRRRGRRGRHRLRWRDHRR